MGLKNHYLGENNVDNMSSRAGAKLKCTSYSGEKRRWNFEKYVKTHVDQDTILTCLVEHGYSGIDDWSNVRHLMAGIKTKVLYPIKTHIMSSATLRNDFDAFVNLYKDFIEQSNNLGVRDTKILSVHSDKNSASSVSGGVKESGTNYDKFVSENSVPDRYYTGEEYQALNDAQKKELKLKRSKRGHKPKVKHGRPPSHGGNKLKMEFSKRSIAGLVLALASQAGDLGGADPISGTESRDGEDKKISKRQDSNCTNKALTQHKN